MEFKLKTISKAGIPEAISKAESIAPSTNRKRQSLSAATSSQLMPEHQLALRLLGLAITDQFSGERRIAMAKRNNFFRDSPSATNASIHTVCYMTAERSADARGTPAPYSRLLSLRRQCAASPKRDDRPPDNDDALLPGTGAAACCKVILAFRKKRV